MFVQIHSVVPTVLSFKVDVVIYTVYIVLVAMKTGASFLKHGPILKAPHHPTYISFTGIQWNAWNTRNIYYIKNDQWSNTIKEDKIDLIYGLRRNQPKSAANNKNIAAEEEIWLSKMSGLQRKK